MELSTLRSIWVLPLVLIFFDSGVQPAAAQPRLPPSRRPPVIYEYEEALVEQRAEIRRALRACEQLEQQVQDALLLIEEARADAEAADKRTTEAVNAEMNLVRKAIARQLQETRLTLAQARTDAVATAKTDADALSARLKVIETAIAQRGQGEIESAESLQATRRLVLIAGGLLAGLGLLALLCAGWLQLRAMNRLTETAAGRLPERGLSRTSGATPVSGSPGVSGVSSMIERLAERVRVLENAVRPPVTGLPGVPSSGGHEEDAVAADPSATASSGRAPEASRADPIPALLGKGHALLHLGQAEKALAVFDEILRSSPRHTGALVKKGTALEHLDRLEEAIACYDHAIGLNPELTLAYLQKGAVCNRLARFDDALKCYEQALKTQDQA